MTAPAFPGLLDRALLKQTILRSDAAVAIMVAAAGYGKTVLAAQVAGSPRFESELWIDCSGILDEAALLPAIVAGFAGHEFPPSDPDNQLLPAPDAADARRRLPEALDAVSGWPLAMVLDNVNLEALGETIQELSTQLRRRHRSCLLVATTRVAEPESLASITDAMVLGASELRLSHTEVLRLVERSTDDGVRDQDVASIIELSDGHAALADMLARSWALGVARELVVESPGISVSGLAFALLKSQVDAQHIAAFQLASLLGEGRVSELCDQLEDVAESGIRWVSECLPLVQVEGAGLLARFRAHDLALELCTGGAMDALVADEQEAAITRLALEILDRRGDLPRLFDIVIRVGSASTLIDWLERRGHQLLSQGHLRLLSRLFEPIRQDALLCRPKLLLLQAQLYRDTARASEALMKAQVARQLAESQGDTSTAVEALMIEARLQLDLGRTQSCADSLMQLLPILDAESHPAVAALASVYLGICLRFLGRTKESIPHLERARRYARSPSTSAEVRGLIALNLAGCSGSMEGDWVGAAHNCGKHFEPGELSCGTEVCLKGDLGACLMEMGRLDRASSALDRALSRATEYGLDGLAHALLSSSACVLAAEGDYRAAAEVHALADEGADALGDLHSRAHSLVYRSVWTRAMDPESDQSLSDAELAIELTSELEQPWLTWLARLETAAGLLTLGDLQAARRLAESVKPAATEAGAKYHLLRADLIVAEAALREDDLEDARAHIAAHKDYLLSDSANWQIAMYCRAFPRLLGLIAECLGPSEIPTHLMRMILPENAERTLSESRYFLADDVWADLGTRLLGDEEFANYVERDGKPVCRVRTFGGLQITIGGRAVSDKAWKKRKSRLLFAMLVARRGQDLSREQIFDHLWPDMEGERAKNNFYVVWSSMKKALLGDDDSAQLPYVLSAQGMCRINTESVRTDLDEFDRVLARARAAEGDADYSPALEAYRDLSEVYRGEFLPGDIYDDWFAADREHYKTEFVHAMRRASEIAEEHDELGAALHFLRRAIAADAWQEDLYQRTLRCQIAAGHRGAAIETYFTCRNRLSEDLGLDPSAETRALYDRILVMEDRPRALDHYGQFDY